MAKKQIRACNIKLMKNYKNLSLYLNDHFPSDTVCKLVNHLSVKTTICIYISKQHRKCLQRQL